jgi:glutamine amidotransferase-like uncharacterized protein
MNKMFLVITFALTVSACGNHSDGPTDAALPHQNPTLPEKNVPPNSLPQVGLYVGRGSWTAGKEHLKMFFNETDFSYVSLTKDDILNGQLEKSGIEVLVMPGGQSWKYLEDLGDKGGEVIRNFVANGKGYMGICAGAFYAVSRREGGASTGPYGIGLLEGTGYDGTSLGVSPFKEGMLNFDMFLSGFKNVFSIILVWGPAFIYTEQEAQKKNIEVIARFQEINKPSMIKFNYGKGRVFLSGPHPEIEEDRTNWGYTDPESDWPILEKMLGFLIGK